MEYDDPMVRRIAQRVADWKGAVTPKPWYIIDPRTSPWIGWWDAVTSFALIFTAMVTPVEVAFLKIPDSVGARWTDPLFLTNRAVDLIFIWDILLQFILMYQDDQQSTHAGSPGGGRWVYSPREIARHYVLSPWFYLDVFSVAVSRCP